MDQHWAMLGQWASAIATLLSGLATLGAVIFALTLQRRLERQSIPTLRVEYDPASTAHNRYLPPSANIGGPGPNRHEVWVRIRVTNKSSYPARDVELRFISTQFANDPVRTNRPSWWFKVSNLNSVKVTIPPYFTQYFDIAYMIREVTAQEAKGFLVLTRPDMMEWNQEKARIEAYGDYTELQIGWPYNIYFAVVGNNYDAAYYRMSLQLSPPHTLGKEMRDCITAGAPTAITSEQAFSESTQ